MRKLYPLLAALVMTVAVAGCSSLGMLGAMLGSQVTFTQPQLQHALDGHFPRRFERAGSQVSLDLSEPTLSIPYSAERLRLEFDATLAIDGRRAHRGRFSLTSGLRYDPATRGLHLHDPVIDTVNLGELGGALDAGDGEALAVWLAEYARQQPIYRLNDSLLQRIAGRQVLSTTIQNGVVVLNLGQ